MTKSASATWLPLLLTVTAAAVGLSDSVAQTTSAIEERVTSVQLHRTALVNDVVQVVTVKKLTVQTGKTYRPDSQ
ncbi:Uncharacterized protein PBTT_02665 [Plasmodiophora brassicae]|uniref:Uncharacterized protein n=1 Tax=Plasmodiophora brassicae TaxID=37360 RepID=A0A0G4ITD1_PLABS|nr:hypothetical protein PBRA_006634 [Plasmodiophora brassicae]